jgi:hypothetical protein
MDSRGSFLPRAPVFSRELREFLIALRRAHRWNISVAELYQSVGTANPDVAFVILERSFTIHEKVSDHLPRRVPVGLDVDPSRCHPQKISPF